MTVTERKSNLIGLILRRNCRIKHVTEGKIGRKEKRGRRRKHLLDDLKEKRILETESRNTRSHSVGKSLWMRLWTCDESLYPSQVTDWQM